MIHFSCMYCGRKLWAKDRLVGSRIRCPACGHKIRIRPAEAPAEGGRAARHGRRDTSAAKEDWREMSDGEIARRLHGARGSSGHPLDRRRVARQALSPWLPHYDSLTLFALSSAFILLLLFGAFKMPGPQWDGANPALSRVLWSLAGPFGLLIPLAGLGMLLSLVGIFYTKPKPDTVKWLMLCFAVVVTGGTGLYAGYIVLRTTRGWLMVFPAWNILNAAVPLLLFRAGLLDTELILDTTARLWQVIVTMVVTTALLVVCLYYFRLHWAITYSICVGYTMSLNHAITDVFGAGGVAAEVQKP